MPQLQLNDLSLHYRIAGSGPRLLFIPGTASDLRQKRTIFDSPLANHFELLCFDPRGIGQSNSPAEFPTMQTYADDIKQLLVAIGWDSCYVAGDSFGGMIAQELAICYPQCVKKLVLCATSSGGAGGSSYPFHQHDLSGMSIADKAALWVEKCDKRAQDPNWQHQQPDLYQQQYQFYHESMTLSATNPQQKMNSQRQINARKQHNTYDRLNQLEMPSYICAGHFDGCAPRENQFALFDKIANSRLSFFNGSHMFLWQDPFAYHSIQAFLLFDHAE